MRWNSPVFEAIRKWDAEVELEAVKLVEKGVPPYDAMAQATWASMANLAGVA